MRQSRQVTILFIASLKCVDVPDFLLFEYSIFNIVIRSGHIILLFESFVGDQVVVACSTTSSNNIILSQILDFLIQNGVSTLKTNGNVRIHYMCPYFRYSKARKEKNEMKYSGMYCNFEIFHMREKQIPVDSVESKDPIQCFAWEPVGSKFAIIHGESPSISVSFYEVRVGQAPILLKKFEKRACNRLHWSPSGQFIVLAGIGANGGGSLEFVDTHEFLVMNTTDHYQMSDVEWDPTGRYVVTGVSFWKTKVDTGYWIWSFQGKILKRINLDKFAQLLWRPRPPTLLTEDKQREIKKNLKKYYAQFESKDRMRQTKASTELIKKRAALMEKFNEHRQRRIKKYNENKARRLALRNSKFQLLFHCILGSNYSYFFRCRY